MSDKIIQLNEDLIEYSGLYDTSVRSFGNRCSEK